MKKIPKKKLKVTELYFNEYDGTAEIYTYNTKHKKRLAAPYSEERKTSARQQAVVGTTALCPRSFHCKPQQSISPKTPI